MRLVHLHQPTQHLASLVTISLDVEEVTKAIERPLMIRLDAQQGLGRPVIIAFPEQGNCLMILPIGCISLGSLGWCRLPTLQARTQTDYDQQTKSFRGPRLHRCPVPASVVATDYRRSTGRNQRA